MRAPLCSRSAKRLIASASLALLFPLLGSACGSDYAVNTGDTKDAGAFTPDGPVSTDASSGSTQDGSTIPGNDAGSTADATSARCDPMKPYGAAVLVSSIDTTGIELGARLTADETLVFFTHADAPPAHAFLAQRSSPTMGFGPSAQVPVINTANSDTYDVSATADGLTVYFTSNRDDPMNGTLSLFVGARPNLAGLFTVTKITTVPAGLKQPFVTPSGGALYFVTSDKVVRAS